MSLIGNGVERVEIGPDWYELKRELGWYAYQCVEEQRKTMIIPIRAGQMPMDGRVEVRYHEADLNAARLAARLLRWSHDEPIGEQTIQLLPLAHAQVLLARITQLEQAEQTLGLDPEGKALSDA